MTKSEFIKWVSPYAIKTQIEYGVPASITIAQAGLESRWGDSKLTKKANNFFGIRAIGDWKGKVYNIDTNEYINGKNIVDKMASFRAYSSPKQSFIDHADFLLTNKRYKNLFDTEDGYKWAEGLQKSGYATAPNYADTLKTIIRQNNLTAFDEIAKKKESPTRTIKKSVKRNRIIWGVAGVLLLSATAYGIYYYKKSN